MAHESTPVRSPSNSGGAYVAWFDTVGSDDTNRVGGKNASLGEMIQRLRDRGIRVPEGFAVTVEGYWRFIDANDLRSLIATELEAVHGEERALGRVGATIRRAIEQGSIPPDLEAEIREAYRELGRRSGDPNVAVAARSSATAEDLPGASFAGQQETYLNVRGEDALLEAVRLCIASLFTDRAISYREVKGFEHMKVGLSVGVQKMVRSGEASAGVMFTIDTESGFPGVVLINSSLGLGELVVKGEVSPDEYLVFKPLLESARRPIISRRLGRKLRKMVYAGDQGGRTVVVDSSDQERRSFTLSDAEVLQLARWGVAIEQHYGIPMDIEWAKDGHDGDLYVLQARPETVQSLKTSGTFATYALKEKRRPLVTGLSIGEGIAVGRARLLRDAAAGDEFARGDILVTHMTSPDWVPIMKRAAAVVTDLGGRTSHAAIVSRELGVPAVIGTETATSVLNDGQSITVSCAEGSTGYVYEGRLQFERNDVSLEDLPQTRTAVMINVGSPEVAFRWWRLPSDGVGLARIEFIISNIIKVHPLALLHPERIDDEAVRQQIDDLTGPYPSKADAFVEQLSQGVARVAAPLHPRPVIVRFSDFKTNEYAGLLGGRWFEPDEENPMLGWRGASRYYRGAYREGFALECAAMRQVRESMGFTNVIPMVPFCRTPEEADEVLKTLSEHGLVRGKDGLSVYLMCELPSNVVLAGDFADRFDGFSIGSNDLTQLVLGIDRDSTALSYLFDERHPAVTRLIASVISEAHQHATPVGICGEAPSDHPEFVEFLVQCGIDSISVNPDRFVEVKRRVAQAEAVRSSGPRASNTAT